MSRPTWAEIDLEAIAHNYRALKSCLGNNTNVLAVVKANAYGYGMVRVARRLVREKVSYLGVACVDEAVTLRREGIRTPILVLSSVMPSDIKEALSYNISLTICDTNLALEIDRQARRLRKPAIVHLKVDTGMGRLGVWHDEADSLIERVLGLKNIILEGIFTHLASADEENSDYTAGQLDNFRRLTFLSDINTSVVKYIHAANSAGAVLYKDAHFNMVRPGLMLYGLYPNDRIPGIIKLKPSLTLKTKIIYLKRTPAGRSISYGRMHTTEKETLIATLPIGYADGLNRGLSNSGQVIVKGRRAGIVGRICMDHTMVDVGHIKGVSAGDEVTIIGSQGNETITVEDIARQLNTIPYEVVCWISSRVPRVYPVRNSSAS